MARLANVTHSDRVVRRNLLEVRGFSMFYHIPLEQSCHLLNGVKAKIMTRLVQANQRKGQYDQEKDHDILFLINSCGAWQFFNHEQGDRGQRCLSPNLLLRKAASVSTEALTAAVEISLVCIVLLS